MHHLGWFTVSIWVVLGLLLFSVCLSGCQEQKSDPSPTIATLPTLEFDARASESDWQKVQLANACSDFVPSPDGQWAVCADDQSIWAVSIAGGQAPTLIAQEKPDVNFSVLGFRPGSPNCVIQSWDYSAKPFTATLWLVDPSNANQRVLLYQGQHPALAVHWSPSGQHFVLVPSSGWAELVINAGTVDQSVANRPQS